MKKITLLLLLIANFCLAQNPTKNAGGFATITGAQTIAPSAIIEARSTTKGVLLSPMTSTQMNAIASPANGLQVTNTSDGNKPYYFDGTSWRPVVGTTPTLAETLAIDNKTNDIPIISNNGNGYAYVNDDRTILGNDYGGIKKIRLEEDNFSFDSNVRFGFNNGVQINSNTDGFGLPILTTTQMNAIAYPTEGMLVRNTTESKIYQFNGTVWEPLGSGGTATLPENEIAFGQSDDSMGSSPNFTYDGSKLLVSKASSSSDGVYLADGYISANYAGVYSPNSDQEIIAFSPTDDIYKAFNGNLSYDVVSDELTVSGDITANNLGGSNYGDETTATIKTKLGISTLSGSNTGDQTITLTGDVTGTGTGSFATTIGTGAVTSDKILDGTIDNTDINASAAIDATKINTGVVSNTEFNYLDNVTSAIQTQFGNKLSVTDPSYTGILTGVGATQSGSSAVGLMDLSQTWNTTGNPSAIKLNVTNTASGASSLLLDLQVNSASLFSVNRLGAVTASSLFTGGILNAIGGISSASGAITANNTQGLRLNGGYQIAQIGGSLVQYMMFSSYRNGHVFTAPAMTYTSGTSYNTQIGHTFNPTSGSATNTALNIAPVINQTGGANGITRGLYIDPTLTSASDFRAIDITGGKIVLSNTNTTAGTTGAQTINKISGSVNFAAAESTLVVTNNLASTSSNIFVQVEGADTTAISARVTKANGSFTITLNAAATAETRVSFWVIN